jgi:hypothetical protein
MADNSFVRLVHYYLLKLKSFFFSKDVLSFLLFFVLASGFWFVNALDKERETEIVVPVNFVGVPQNITITNKIQSIRIKIKDQGLNLFTYSRNSYSSISFDLGRVFYEKGRINISPDQIRGKIARFLLPSTSILEILPDSLSIQYEKLSTKTLPVEFDAKIELSHQYVLSDDISISPSMITVFGPKSVLDKLKTIKTEFVELKKLSDTTYINTKLRPLKSVNFASDEVKVGLFVEMFTEKNIQLPITIINCPENVVIRTFPAMINVTFNVGMSHFNAINSEDLSAVLDYSEIEHNQSTKQTLKLINTKSFISNVKFEPEEVEYIIEMKKTNH